MIKRVSGLSLGSVMFTLARSKSKGLTQHELADKMGISRNKINHYETGKTEPKPSIIESCIDVLELDFSTIYIEAKDLIRSNGVIYI